MDDDRSTGGLTPLETVTKPGALSTDRVFVQHYRSHDYHPVIFFGTQLSGKTALLLSLLAYATHHARLGVQVNFAGTSASDLFPNDYQANNNDEKLSPEKLFSSAKQFFDDGVPQFNAGYLPAATQTRNPIFVPVSLTKETRYNRFLFVEGNGEWYHRDRETQAYRPLVNEINWLLANFDGPISVVFVVPATPANLPADLINYNQMLGSVKHCMDVYSRYSRRGKGDNLLLVGTQWDTLPNSPLLAGGGGPVDIPAEEFERVAARTWGPVWAGFVNLQVEAGRRAAMPYSIGRVQKVSTGSPGLTTGLYTQDNVFNQFPRILWNWLYGNATEGSLSNRATRQTLFDDVDIKAGSGPNFISEWLYQFYAIR